MNTTNVPQPTIQPAPICDRGSVAKPRNGFATSDEIARRIAVATDYLGTHSKAWHPGDRERACRELGARFIADADYWKERNERDGVPS